LHEAASPAFTGQSNTLSMGEGRVRHHAAIGQYSELRELIFFHKAGGKSAGFWWQFNAMKNAGHNDPDSIKSYQIVLGRHAVPATVMLKYVEQGKAAVWRGAA
jgi:hypothetical protein